MTKKILFILMVGVMVLSACTPGNTTATPTEAVTEEVTEAATEEAEAPTEEQTIVSSSVEIVAGESMPCVTIYDDEVSEDYQLYQEVVDQLPAISEDDWIKGNADAPVTIVEYADFQCPACANFSLTIAYYQALYPDTFRIVFRHMPLASIHPLAYISSMAAEAAGAQGMFWEMYELLYGQQSAWSSLTEEEFIDWALGQAESLELDLTQFEADMTDAEAQVALEEQTNAQLALGVHYTPFVYVNGRIMDSYYILQQYVSVYNYEGYDACPPWVISPDKSYTAKFDTTAGEILIDLNVDAAPLAVNSFVYLVENGWFDDAPFHRVIEGFVAQTGDKEGFGPGYTFANETESGLSFDSAGVLGMANAGADTNGSQFFITLAPVTTLDGSYTVFGRVQEDSLAVLDEIALRDPDTAVGFDDATFINAVEIIEN